MAQESERLALVYDETAGMSQGVVECLGVTFLNDVERREFFLEKLREKLRDPEFRKIEGFPIGTDEDILRLSDPPYFTACPNPFLEEFIEHFGKPYNSSEAYSREPLAIDVSEGKTASIYRAHAYHTKVPPAAIIPAILHYTEPGDIILDGFAGTGMTGVAAQMCNVADPEIESTLDKKWQDHGKPKWGPRRVVLNDLSPIASFIAANYNTPFDVVAFEQQASRILNEIDKEIGWMYETLHVDGRTKARINFTVWSEIFSCPECTGDVVFVEEALDSESKTVAKSITCPHCSSRLTKEQMQLQFEAFQDPGSLRLSRRPKRKPVLINYSVGKTRFEKKPDEEDLALIERIARMELPSEVPTNNLPDCQMTRVGRMATTETTAIHHMFLPRAAQSLAQMWRRAQAHGDTRTRNALLFFVDQAIWTMSLLNRYRPTGYSQVNQFLSGVFYIPSQHSECSPWYVLTGKLQRLSKTFREFVPTREFGCISTTSSTTTIGVPEQSLDYIFTDPPFGENIYYADLNYLVESWYRVWSSPEPEAILDRVRNKGIAEYQHLMQECFEEYHRVLKPGRWMTVVFHNSKNSVWNAIQEALQAAGFIVADVRTLDKQQGSFRQVTSSAVKQDLVISAYRPNDGLEERFKLDAGTENGVWNFVNTHLRQLPVFVSKDGRVEVITERQNFLLYDRMVAFHVQRGVMVPVSASEFYGGLDQRFPARDDMYFLPEQVAEYDKKRMTATDVETPEFTPVDEYSAIRWLQNLLRNKPQSFQEIHPQFLRDIGGWQKHEKPLELRDELLEENFLHYDGLGEVPSQIHSYLSTNFREMRNLAKDDSALRAKAKDRWYVPDPSKAQDLEKLRESALLKEFEQYRHSSQRKLRVFRVEAVRAGFKKAWQDRDYPTIIAAAEKIPDNVLQEDPKLLMWYDQAMTRVEG